MRDLAFWLAVAAVAVAAVIIFRVIALRIPWHPLNVLAAAV